MSRRLRIVGVNDVYSLAQLPRLATLIAEARTIAPADVTLVTIAGDFLAPSLLSSLDHGRAVVDCLRALGVTHVTLGNHEDELEPVDLDARLRELGATVLVANAAGLSVVHQPTDVIDVGGFRVGLVGVVDGDPTLYRRAPFGGALIGETVEAVRRASAKLRAEGCAAVIALTHQPLPLDRVLASAGIVDLVLGGHEHDGSLDRDHGAPLVKAPMNAAAAIVAELTFEHPASPRVEVAVRLVPVASYVEDAAMRARVDAHLALVRELEERTLLVLPEGTSLCSAGSRQHPTTFGTLVCSRLRDVLDADIALYNGGGLRGEAERRGRLTYADLREELPFDNEVVVALVPGAVIADTLRHARTALRGTGGYLHVDDRARVDDDGTVHAIGGSPLDPDRPYRVATLRAFFFGMDHLAPLEAFARAHPEAVPPATTGLEVKVALLRSFAASASV